MVAVAWTTRHSNLWHQFKNRQNIKRDMKMDFWLPSCCFLVLLAFTFAYEVREAFSVDAVIGQKVALKCEVGSLAEPLQLFGTAKMPAVFLFCMISTERGRNEAFETCSKHITWSVVRGSPATVYVNPVGIADDGLYEFDILVLGSGKSFSCHITLNVIVPPVVQLTFDDHGTAVCQAAGGKPAANISWQVKCEDYITENVPHDNKTVTVTSKYRARSENENSVMCIVSHPTFSVPYNLSSTFTATAPRSFLTPTTLLGIQIFGIQVGLAAIVLTVVFVLYRKLKKNNRMISAVEMSSLMHYNQRIHGELRP